MCAAYSTQLMSTWPTSVVSLFLYEPVFCYQEVFFSPHCLALLFSSPSTFCIFWASVCHWGESRFERDYFHAMRATPLLSLISCTTVYAIFHSSLLFLFAPNWKVWSRRLSLEGAKAPCMSFQNGAEAVLVNQEFLLLCRGAAGKLRQAWGTFSCV